MGSGSSIPVEKHIVIVGGGYSGFTLASALQAGRSNFTLISTSPVFYHNIGSVRALVERDFGKKLFIPLDKVFGDNFKSSTVTSVSPGDKTVQLVSGDSVPYDVLVIATGTSGGFPFKLRSTDVETELYHLDTLREKVEEAKRILVIGGGATGTEQAMEIATKYPSKEVTLLHSKERLIGDNHPERFYKRLHQILNSYKIKVILGERVDNLDELATERVHAVNVKTNKGTNIQVDLVLRCVGLKVHPEAYTEGLGDKVDERGCLKVNEFLQVEGQQHIFALGDCNNLEPNLAYVAELQAELLIKNLKVMFTNKAMTAWDKDSVKIGMVLGLGPDNGIGHLKSGMMLPEFICKIMKSRDMLVPDMWKKAGLKVPHEAKL